MVADMAQGRPKPASFQQWSGRLGRMGVVAGMHVVAIYVVATSLGIVPPPEILKTEPIDIVERPTIPPPQPPPAQPTMRTVQQIVVPLPEVPIDDTPVVDTVTARSLPVDEIPVDTSGSAEVLPQIVGVRQDPRRPLTQPPYPAAEIRAGNEGNADVEVYVLPNGRVGEARIVRSTGFERLDRAALEEARRNWRLVPATRDGVPYAEWYRVRVVFRLTNQ